MEGVVSTFADSICIAAIAVIFVHWLVKFSLPGGQGLGLWDIVRAQCTMHASRAAFTSPVTPIADDHGKLVIAAQAWQDLDGRCVYSQRL